MAASEIVVDVKLGPNLTAVMELLETIGEVQDFFPEWHRAERNVLLAKARRLQLLVAKELRERNT